MNLMSEQYIGSSNRRFDVYYHIGQGFVPLVVYVGFGTKATHCPKKGLAASTMFTLTTPDQLIFMKVITCVI